jgi:4-hydroxy-tetrahydrodipicolinate synthase
MVCEEVNGKVPVIAGAYGESTQSVIECGLDAKKVGADAILIMPPFSFYWGATQYPEVILIFFGHRPHHQYPLSFSVCPLDKLQL